MNEIDPTTTKLYNLEKPVSWYHWTRALPTPLDKYWQPNHFVPCLRNSNRSPILASNMETAEVPKDNVVVSRTAGNVIRSSISTLGVKRACSHKTKDSKKSSASISRDLKVYFNSIPRSSPSQSPSLQTGSTQHSQRFSQPDSLHT